MVKVTEKKTGMKVELKAWEDRIAKGAMNILITTPEGKIVDITVWQDGGTLVHHAKDVTISQYEIVNHEIVHGQHTTKLKPNFMGKMEGF